MCVSKEVEYKVIGSLLIVYQKDRKRHRSPDWFGICPSKKGNLPALIWKIHDPSVHIFPYASANGLLWSFRILRVYIFIVGRLLKNPRIREDQNCHVCSLKSCCLPIMLFESFLAGTEDGTAYHPAIPITRGISAHLWCERRHSVVPPPKRKRWSQLPIVPKCWLREIS